MGKPVEARKRKEDFKSPISRGWISAFALSQFPPHLAPGDGDLGGYGMGRG